MYLFLFFYLYVKIYNIVFYQSELYTRINNMET